MRAHCRSDESMRGFKREIRVSERSVRKAPSVFPHPHIFSLSFPCVSPNLWRCCVLHQRIKKRSVLLKVLKLQCIAHGYRPGSRRVYGIGNPGAMDTQLLTQTPWWLVRMQRCIKPRTISGEGHQHPLASPPEFASSNHLSQAYLIIMSVNTFNALTSELVESLLFPQWLEYNAVNSSSHVLFAHETTIGSGELKTIDWKAMYGAFTNAAEYTTSRIGPFEQPPVVAVLANLGNPYLSRQSSVTHSDESLAQTRLPTTHSSAVSTNNS